MIGRKAQEIFEETQKRYQRAFKKAEDKAIMGINLPVQTYELIIKKEIPNETFGGLIDLGILVRQFVYLPDISQTFLKISCFNPQNLIFIIGKRNYLKEIGERSGGDYTIRDLI